MSRERLSKSIIRLAAVLMVVLLIGATSAPARAASFSDAITAGGDRLVATQNADGGWGWPLTGASAANTVAQAGMGLVAAYDLTGNTTYYNALVKAADLAIAPGHGPYTTTGIFLDAVSDITGNSDYRDHFASIYGDNAAGKRTVNTVPRPGSLSTSMRPPWASTMRRHW